MNCISPLFLTKGLSVIDFPDGLSVPCGKCMACRIAKSKEWSVRLYHELEYHDDAMFLTLTYKDEYLNDIDNPSLVKDDLTKFFKRLRKELSYEKRIIKHFSVGEYGTQFKRPHYHSIIYGMSINKSDRLLVMDNWPYTDWTIQEICKGAFKPVNPERIEYIARYCQKKLNGDMAVEEYVDREPLFMHCSKGIGERFARDNVATLEERGFTTLRGKKHGIPRYYVKKFNIDLTKAKEQGSFKESETVELYTGLNTNEAALYRHESKEYMKYNDKIKQAKKQHDLNLKTKLQLKSDSF